MFPEDSKEAADQAGMVHQIIPNDAGQGKGDEAASKEIKKLVRDFLDGRPGVVLMVAGWARSIAAHKTWGFQAPEDIVQAALLALIKNLREGRFKGGNLQAYVRRIAKNMCITNYRRIKARGDHISLEECTHHPSNLRSGEDVERRALLNRILDKLNESCRQIILLAYVQGYSRKEIGKHLGISEEAARIKLFRCIQNARSMLSEFGDTTMEHA